jgi:hypothetical protein
METLCSSETFDDSYRTTLGYIPTDIIYSLRFFDDAVRISDFVASNDIVAWRADAG